LSKCQSAINLPTIDAGTRFRGFSLPLERHYMVRLLLEYTEHVAPEQHLFQASDVIAAGNHPSWGDYDNDGFDDLLVDHRLYHNEGGGLFSDMTAAIPAPITGGVWGDYNNDGCLDLFGYSASPATPDALFRGDCAGEFKHIEDSGIVDEQSDKDCGGTWAPSTAAAWVDINADGDLDLYVVNDTCTLDETYYRDRVFINKGNGAFREATNEFGPEIRRAGRAVVPIDHDRDGDVDIHVGSYRLQPNMFWQNESGAVSEMGSALHLAGVPNVEISPAYGNTIGLAWGDLDNDGDFDNVTANLAHPRFFGYSDKTQVLLNDGGSYRDNSGDWTRPVADNGLRYQETHAVPMLGDFDQDGALDLVITSVYEDRPTDFYWGNGDGTFRLDSYHVGISTTNGLGIGASDIDNDGDLDVYASRLFINERAATGHWLQVRVLGKRANRSAIGATVEVTADNVTRLRHVPGGSGQGGQDSLYLHFGIGDSKKIQRIRVVFPGGDEEVYAGPIDADQRVWLKQGSSKVRAGWEPPEHFF
jgi:hypothetical protein